jgi:D-sedoheptulose 7-phosphate isomerase
VSARRDKPQGPLEREGRRLLRQSSRALERLERACAGAVAAAAEVTIACLEAGGTVYFCGNGGSAADAQHLACELAGRYLMQRPGLAAVALSTNTSSLTAIGNDYGFDQVFSRQLEGLGEPGDVLVAITTSGNSPNVMRAARVARRLGMTVIGMTGLKGNRFAAACDIALITPQTVTPRVQEGHLVMGHALCELIERGLFGRRPAVNGARRRTRARPRARRAASGAASAGSGGKASASRARALRARRAAARRGPARAPRP